MSLEARSLIGLAIATALAYWATPIAIRLADRYDFYDKPRGFRTHGAPTPYLGGIAVVAAFALALVSVGSDWSRTLPILAGVLVMCAVGTIDDRRTLTPGVRLVVEAGAGLALWALGLGWDLGLGAAVDVAATVLWIIAVVNAFNLFDNMDGAASSMAAVVAIGLAVFAIAHGNAWLAASGLALAGACLGFLPHNLASPARIFLGDGGSMPIGFAVAALTMAGVSGSAPALQSLAMGLLLVGVPALDTALVIVSRLRRGVSILTGGRDHLTHRALLRLRTARAVALTLGGGQALISALAVVAIGSGSAVLVPLVAFYVVLAGVAITYLDTRLAPVAETTGTPAAGAREARVPLRLSISMGLLALLGIAAGLSPLVSGYYDSSVWVPGGLAVVALAAAVAIARPVALTRLGAVALAALGGLGAWALVSSQWSSSVEDAVTDANRLLVYAALLGVLLALMRSRRAAAAGVAAFAASAFVLAALVLGRMIAGDENLFLGGRLNEPLGYINGQGDFFLLAAWPALALAEERRRPWVAAAGVALMTVAAGLALLSQSRGLALAALVTGVLLLALVPGRARRARVLAVVAVALGAAAPWLLDVYEASGAGVGSALRTAALVLTAVALAAGAASHGLELLDGRLDPRSGRRLATGAAAGLAALLLVGAVLAGPTVADKIDSQYHDFVSLGQTGRQTPGASTSRLLSGGGKRYDYWRIAVKEWRGAPLVGVGAGAYDVDYFKLRRTDEDVRQPHSLGLQTLAELGLVGFALLLTFVGAVAVGLGRAARSARTVPADRLIAVAAGGVIVTWLVHGSVDWLHLFPGLTAAALIASAALLRQPRVVALGAEAPAAVRRTPRYAAAVVVGVVLAITAISLNRQLLGDYFRDHAQSALADNPAEALEQVDRSLRIDPDNVPAYYIKAAALARFGQGPAARRVMLEAARREPANFVTYSLLGDLAVRDRHSGEAEKLYRRSLALNPRDGATIGALRLAESQSRTLGPGPAYPESR